MYRNYLKTVPYHCEQRNNDKAYKTISKMAEPSKNGVRKVVFLTKVDFSVKNMLVLNLLRRLFRS